MTDPITNESLGIDQDDPDETYPDVPSDPYPVQPDDPAPVEEGEDKE